MVKNYCGRNGFSDHFEVLFLPGCDILTLVQYRSGSSEPNLEIFDGFLQKWIFREKLKNERLLEIQQATIGDDTA